MANNNAHTGKELCCMPKGCFTGFTVVGVILFIIGIALVGTYAAEGDCHEWNNDMEKGLLEMTWQGMCKGGGDTSTCIKDNGMGNCRRESANDEAMDESIPQCVSGCPDYKADFGEDGKAACQFLSSLTFPWKITNHSPPPPPVVGATDMTPMMNGDLEAVSPCTKDCPNSEKALVEKAEMNCALNSGNDEAALGVCCAADNCKKPCKSSKGSRGALIGGGVFLVVLGLIFFCVFLPGVMGCGCYMKTSPQQNPNTYAQPVPMGHITQAVAVPVYGNQKV